MGFFGDLFGGDDNTGGMMRRQQIKSDQAMALGGQKIENAFAGYGEPFFQGVRQASINYAMPQLAGQYAKARMSTMGNLAAQGLTRSGVADRAYYDLGQQYAAGQQGVVNAAEDVVNQTKASLQGQKNTLYSELSASQNPSAVAAQALSLAGQFTAPNALQPLANEFSSNMNMAAYYAMANAMRGGGNVNYVAPSSQYGGTSAGSGASANQTYYYTGQE